MRAKNLKKRILDTIGVAIGALDGEPTEMIRTHKEDFGGAPYCTLIGGGKTASDRAAFYNGALNSPFAGLGFVADTTGSEESITEAQAFQHIVLGEGGAFVSG